MKTTEKDIITVNTLINAPIDQVWKCWSTPDDILKWNNASDGWQAILDNFKKHAGKKQLGRYQ